MKKLLSFILVSLLVMTCFTTVAFAAGSATITASSATAHAGDVVSIDFTLSGDEFSGFGMYITCDSTLSVDSVEQGPAAPGRVYFNPNKNNIVTCAGGENVEGGVIFTAKFKVSENAKPGKYAVSVTVDNVADENDQDLTVSVVKGYITVVCDHSYGDWNTVNAASCFSTGTAKRTCSKCGNEETKTLPAIGSHSYGDWTTVNPADCKNNGTAERVCSVCGNVDTKTLPATGNHTWGQWNTVNEPTCTVSGTAERICSVCGDKETKTLPATGIHVYGDWNVVQPATCTVDGKAERSCACGDTETKVITATGHAWGDWATVTEASCETDGLAKRICSKCGEEETTILPAANAHTWGDWTTVTEASCETDGLAKRICDKCGKEETKVLPAANAHAWGDWTVVTEASCETDGLAKRICSKCGKEETKVLPAANAHVWGELTVITEPTCTEDGEATHTCSKCGKEEKIVLEATGHKISDKWATDGTNHWHTCDNGCGELFDMGKHDFEWVITKNPGQNATGLKHQECKACGFACEDVEIPAEPDLDDVPQTSDPTMVLTFSLVGFLSLLLAAAYVTKRKFIK